MFKKRLLLTIISLFAFILLLVSCNEPPHEHVFSEWTVLKQSSCTEHGYEKRLCECGKAEFKEIEKLAHTESIIEAIEPTCTSIGLTEGKICSVCNTVLAVRNIIPSKGHLSVTQASIAPTCTSIGLSEGSYCSVCNTVLTTQTAIPALGHKYNSEIVSGSNLKSFPTCTEPAVYYEVCACGERSGNTFYNGAVNRSNHQSSEIVRKCNTQDEYWHVSKDVWKCCGEVARNPIKEGHEFENDVCIVCQYTMYKDFAITAKNRAEIGFTGKENEELVVPSKFKGSDGIWYKVVAIEEGAFWSCKNLKSIVLPDTITRIEPGTFSFCSNLESCVLPNGITSLYSTFYECTSLKSIILPDSLTSIGHYAFFNCNKLTTITLPKNLRSLDDSALRWCSSLTSIVVPEKVTVIGYAAFELNTALTTVTLPQSLTFIDECVFSSCRNLRKIIYQGTKEEWNNITLSNAWHQYIFNVLIQCTDGEIVSVSSGTETLRVQ